MKAKDIPLYRLCAQQLLQSSAGSLKEIVSQMGAMQAQDYHMSKWAVGIRQQDSTEAMVQKAMDNGEILRTHLLRPTWHLVAAEDIYWMLELTAPQIKAVLKSRHKELELDDTIINKTNKIIEKALSKGLHLTREELMSLMTKARINTDENRASHIMLHAEMEGIVCSGASKGKQQTYALLEQRVSEKKTLQREEALARLALRYFTSHGPATLQDFTWWSGLTITEAKKALESVKQELASESIGEQMYWLSPSLHIPKAKKDHVYLLPAYDEYLISYKDRTASLPLHGHSKTISNNGIFRPVVVVNGIVTGIWKRTIKKDKVTIEVDYFEEPDKTKQKLIEKEAQRLGDFLGVKSEVSSE